MRRAGAALRWAAQALAAAFFAAPLVWMFATAFKVRGDVIAPTPVFWFAPTLENFVRVLTATPFPRHLLNSLIVAAASTLLALILGAPCAHGFARHGRFRGAESLFFWVLSLRMLPPVALAVPFYVAFSGLGLHDTLAGLTLIHTVANLPLAIWLLKGFFEEVPRELEESAALEGLRPWAVFRRVSLPLAAPGLAATAVLCLLTSLNEYLFALVMTAERAVTAPVGLANFQRYFGLQWGEFAAAATLFVLPLLVFTWYVQPHLVRGLSAGRRSA
jgi:multiple sugar transport system permease protein